MTETTSRRLAIDALERIETGGAYANLLVPELLDDSGLETRDRRFVTELVYGVTRRKRALDFLVDRFLDRDDIEPRVRAALRLGAYQLVELGTPPHAAVDATVAATPKRARGFVNAVLRKVATAPSEYPTDAIRLSYPDWIVDRLANELGPRSIAVLEAMNQPAITHTRADGYRQDLSSQAVAALVEVPPGSAVIDLCAAPGGKSTAIAGSNSGVTVVGVDLHPHRAGLVRTAASDTASHRTDSAVHAVVADGAQPPFAPGIADAVLVDAPCSGLGSLRRRPDARWRITAHDVSNLAELQFELVRSAATLVRPGGTVVFSVCTLTEAESVAVDARITHDLPELEPDFPTDGWLPWEAHGRGGRLLPDTFAGDGMAAFRYLKQ
ncbi:MAG: transcription antitermination factor NusB [Acidimicrobiales bacterium]